MNTSALAWISAAVILAATVGIDAASIREPDAAPPESISRYMVGTRLGYITCSNKYRDYVDRWDRFSLVNEGQNTVTGTPPSADDYRGCIQETLAKGRNMYGSAAKFASTNSAKAALKDYQSAWEGSLNTLGRTGGGEKPFEYRSRQSKVQAQLDQMQRKVETLAK